MAGGNAREKRSFLIGALVGVVAIAAGAAGLVLGLQGGDSPASAAAEQGTCESPPPLPERTSKGWRRNRTALLTVTQGPANHRGQDVVVAVGEPQTLNAKLAYGPYDKDLKHEDVEVFIQREPPCSAWESLGTVRTTKEGEIPSSKLGTWDDGGRAFVEIPPDKRLPEGRYPVVFRAVGDGSKARLFLYVLPPGSPVVIFDIDGTLTTGDDQLVQEVAAKVLEHKYVPVMREGAPEVAKAWVDAGVQPIYLSGRPDLLKSETEKWLHDKGFPVGPLHLADRLRETVVGDDFVGTFKVAWLARLEAQAKVRIVAAYGNAHTDIVAYRKAGIDPARTFIVGRRGGSEGTQALGAYDAPHLTWIVANAAPKAP